MGAAPDKEVTAVASPKRDIKNPVLVVVMAILLFLGSQIIAAILLQPVLLSVESKNLQLLLYSMLSGLAVFWLYKLSDLKQPVFKSLGFIKPQMAHVRSLIPITLVYIVASVTLTILISLLFTGFNAEQAQEIGFTTQTNFPELVAAFISLVIITPVIEEVIFRGVLFRGLRTRYSFWPVAVFSSIVFAFAHGQWNVAIDTFALGIALAYLVEKTGGITMSIALHALKNLIAFSFIFVIQ